MKFPLAGTHYERWGAGFFIIGRAMGQVATLLILLLACAYGAFRLVRADRRAGAARSRNRAEKEMRREREKELLDRLERIREKKDDLQATKDAIAADPKRAAKVVSKMMGKT